jgi:O-acetyl-ADP-ribose deacetylase (regulator of RNase III)
LLARAWTAKILCVARVEIREGDLTEMDVDAIVNAANTDLLLGSGVAGAIRTKGGPEIQRECDRHGPVPLGGAALTGAGRLRARHVIHAAGMAVGGSVDEASLRACTTRALELAAEHDLRSIAFPAIGTGVGGFSVQRCAEVMLEEVHRFLERPGSLEEVHFVLYGEPAYRVFEQVADAEKIRRQLAKLPR